MTCCDARNAGGSWSGLMNPASDSVRDRPATRDTATGVDAPAAGGWRAPQGRPTTTLLLRHGQTSLSVERRFAGRGDIPLTDLGLQQAVAAAAGIAERGRVDLVVTSPLRRAWQTALAVAERTGAPLTSDDDLVETDFGSWEGMTFAEVMARWPDEMTAWMASADAAPPGGESIVCRVLLAPSAALFRMHLDVASLSEAAWFADGPALLRSLNDTAHLRNT